jgi:hypothetical protein
MVLGYYTNFYVSFGIGTGFELYEHFVHDCGSLLDFMYNMLGFLIGSYFKPQIK